jgi:EAL domain-containing protein (putative c-di-GMP-specific phosphodiesterase class I)
MFPIGYRRLYATFKVAISIFFPPLSAIRDKRRSKLTESPLSPVNSPAFSSHDALGSVAEAALVTLDTIAARVNPAGNLAWNDRDRALAMFGLVIDPDLGLPSTVAALDAMTQGAISNAMAAGRPVRHRIGRLLEFRFDLAGLITVRRLGLGAIDRRGADAGGRSIQAAIEEGRLLLLHQPIVDAISGAVLRHECLARLVDSAGAVISPAEFIPIAERAGLIGMLDLATAGLALKSAAANPDLALAVNVSAATVADEKARRSYLERLALSPMQSRQLTVEITETIAIEDLDVAAHFAGEVRKLGARVALDDFGEGHTSFRSLLKIPLDEVKIDGLYVEKIDTRQEARAFVRAIDQLSRELGLETVAERVETEAEAAALRTIGVGSMQGYHFGRPTAPAAT